MKLAFRSVALLAVVFAGVTVIASALGAANLGTAATAGQVAFVGALVALMALEGRRR